MSTHRGPLPEPSPDDAPAAGAGAGRPDHASVLAGPLATARRSSPILALLGTVVTLAGCGGALVQLGFFPLSRTIVVSGLALLGAALLLRLADLLAAVRGPGVLGRGATVVGAALLVCGLAVVNVQARRFDARLDLTKGRQHTLGSLTMAALGRLKEPVKVSALVAGPPPDYVRDMLWEFERHARGLIKWEIVDPLTNLAYAAEFGPKIDAQDRRIVVRSQGKGPVGRDDVPFKDTPLTEERLAAAIIKVSSGRQVVDFLSGHGEYEIASDTPAGLSRLRDALAGRGLQARSLLLATQRTIPKDTAALVVAGAKIRPSKDERDTIAQYVRQGGHLLLLVESVIRSEDGGPPPADRHPDFNDMLLGWGVRVGDDVVVDLSNHVGSDVGCPATNQYPPHEKIVSNLGITFFIRPRSVTLLPVEGLWQAPLVTTLSHEQAWAETDRRLRVKFDEGTDTRGPIGMGAIVMRPLKGPRGDSARATKLVVIGAASFVTNEFTDRYSNLDLVANAIAWLAQPEPILAAGTRPPASEPRLDLTARDLRLALVVTGMVPVLVVGFGVLVYWRRHGLV